MKYVIVAVFSCMTLLFASNPRSMPDPQRILDHVIWDGNQIATIHGNHGDIVSYHMTGSAGLEWPIGSGKTAVFQSGLWLAAGKVNGVEEIRTAAAEYVCEFDPGTFGSNPTDSEYHIYSIHAGDDQSNPDWQNWPIVQGAPWVDVDGDGVYDPNIDHPDIKGDLFQWYVMNDSNSSTHTPLWATSPLGVEVRVSMFGFDSLAFLEDVVFVKWEVENKGSDILDSVFLSLWSDPDIGDYVDDFVGCDPDLNLGYSYNDFGGDNVYGSNPPAVGYLILQTPTVPSPGDTAWVSGQPVLDFKNVPLSAFTMYFTGDTNFTDPQTAWEAFNYMNGLIGPTGAPYIDPTTGDTSTFVMDGDPVTGSGWVDYNQFSSGDRRFLITTGPVSLHPGDTQELVAAIILSQGATNLLSVDVLRADVDSVITFWDMHFKYGSYIPSAPQGLAATTGDEIVVLSWDTNPESNIVFYNVYRDIVSPATTVIDSVSYTTFFLTFYQDTNVVNDQTYYYRISAVNTFGNESGLSNEVEATPTGQVAIGVVDQLPDVFRLHQNYPNPFNPNTTIRYDLPERAQVSLVIYDLLGREVRTLVAQFEEAGYRSVIWEGTNDQGRAVGAGVYLYRIAAGDYVKTNKMILLK